MAEFIPRSTYDRSMVYSHVGSPKENSSEPRTAEVQVIDLPPPSTMDVKLKPKTQFRVNEGASTSNEFHHDPPISTNPDTKLLMKGEQFVPSDQINCYHLTPT